MDRDRVPARFGVQEDTGLRSENQREWQEQRRISRAMMATSKARRQRMPEPTDTRLRSWVRVRKTNRTVPLILVGPRADTLQNWVSWGVHVHPPVSLHHPAGRTLQSGVRTCDSTCFWWLKAGYWTWPRGGPHRLAVFLATGRVENGSIQKFID